jgi:hypothetical protein
MKRKTGKTGKTAGKTGKNKRTETKPGKTVITAQMMKKRQREPKARLREHCGRGLHIPHLSRLVVRPSWHRPAQFRNAPAQISPTYLSNGVMERDQIAYFL